MAGNKVMELEFDNPNKLFISGESIRGVLIVDVQPDTVIENIYLVLKAVLKTDSNCEHPTPKTIKNGKKNDKTPSRISSSTKNEEVIVKMSKKPSTHCIQEEVKNPSAHIIQGKLLYKEKLYYTENGSYERKISLKSILVNKSNKKENIIYQHIELLYDGNKAGVGTNSNVLKVGRENFKFCITLPTNLPPSLELGVLYVRYTLWAVLERMEGLVKANYKISSELSVNTLHNTNDVYKSVMPKTVFIKKDHNYLSCIPVTWYGNSMHAQLQINRRAFVPGDFITFNAAISNRSSNIILYVKLYLMQIVKLSCGRKFKRQVVDRMRGSIMARGVQLWKDEYLHIPPVPCTTYTLNLKIKYKIQMEIIRNGSRAMSETERVMLKIPIVIGNIPLDSLTKTYEDGLSGYIKFQGPYIPFADCGLCDYASKLDTSFIPSYIIYSVKENEHDDDNDEDDDSVFEING